MAGGNKGATMQARLKGDLLSLPVAASTTIFRGAAVTVVLANGGAGHNITKGNHFAGMAEEGVVNAGALGAVNVRVRRRGVYRFQYTRTVTQETVNATALATANGGLETIVTVGATTNFVKGDYVTFAGFTGDLAVYNGTFLVTAVVAGTNDTLQIQTPYVAGTPAGTETADIAKCVATATDLLKVAYLKTVQTASVEEQAHAMATGTQDVIVLGPIVKLEAYPSPHVWIDIRPSAEAYQPVAT